MQNHLDKCIMTSKYNFMLSELYMSKLLKRKDTI
jgi:hypothetical protein